MDEQKLNHFKERLLAERRRLQIELENSERFNLNQPLTDSTGELSAYDNHPADLGSETFEREKDLALWDNLHETYQRVNEALQRINDGSYGICEECSQEIGVERLEALPYTSLCIVCQSAEEEQFVNNRQRPIEEETLTPPFSRTFRDQTEVVGIDGEDIWQSVARYGTSESPSDLGGALDYGDTFFDAAENQGIVEPVDAVIDVGPDDIPPDPGNPDQQD